MSSGSKKRLALLKVKLELAQYWLDQPYGVKPAQS
jgi:hypothetical protein